MPRKPISISQLNAYIAKLISTDTALSDIAAFGEVSNFKVHGSGHVYFSLVDEGSRIDCFLPSGIYRGLGFKLADGAEVVAEGYVNVYEKGGRYSLTIRRLVSGGQGDLSQAFEQLKQKLAEKGYFDESHKKPLPVFPKTIAVVTSNTGAAINDIRKIITSRNSVADILIFPTLVQGEGAAEMIASRIRQANADFPEADVMIVGRGGGSSEDLWAFNEEAVADAIFHSKIPVISAVGHETDFTIADFVADRRAETPTAAVMMAAPDTDELAEDLDMALGQIRRRVSGLASNMELRLRANNMGALISRLKQGISERETHTAALLERISVAMRAKVGRAPEFERHLSSIRNAVHKMVDRAAYRAQGQSERIDALNPLGVLTRGYAIIEVDGGGVVSQASALAPGQGICARFADGTATATVKEVELDGK